MSEEVLALLISSAVILPLGLALLVVVVIEVRRGGRDKGDQ